MSRIASRAGRLAARTPRQPMQTDAPCFPCACACSMARFGCCARAHTRLDRAAGAEEQGACVDADAGVDQSERAEREHQVLGELSPAEPRDVAT
eukprot:2463488-Pleurochrysis_carterae.AAC.1